MVQISNFKFAFHWSSSWNQNMEVRRVRSPKKASFLFCSQAFLIERLLDNNTLSSSPFPKHFTQMPCLVLRPLPSSKMASLLKLLSTHHWSKRPPPTLRWVRDLFREISQSKWNINITPDYPKMIFGIMHKLVICIDTGSGTGSREIEDADPRLNFVWSPRIWVCLGD